MLTSESIALAGLSLVGNANVVGRRSTTVFVEADFHNDVCTVVGVNDVQCAGKIQAQKGQLDPTDEARLGQLLGDMYQTPSQYM